MPKKDVNSLLKKRMEETQRASELEVGNAAYESLFQMPPQDDIPRICKLPIDKLCPFFSANIGFKPYPKAKLKALAEHMADIGQLERVIVRKIPTRDGYEILSGHNRINAAKLNGWKEIDAEIVEADDSRATTIAVATNLLRRQDLTIIERGWAYKALLDAQRKQGLRSDLLTSGELRQKLNSENVSRTFGELRQKFRDIQSHSTFGELRQKLDEDYDDEYDEETAEKARLESDVSNNGVIYGMAGPRHNARKIVAEFFGVTEYEVRKAIKVTRLIPELQEILESNPKMLSLACAYKIADYDKKGQQAFLEMCTIKGYQLNSAVVNCIVKKCPPPSAGQQALYAAWREARAAVEHRKAVLANEIRLDRKRFEPYLQKVGSETELENLFFEFLRSRYG